jgi:hypothetical protein
MLSVFLLASHQSFGIIKLVEVALSTGCGEGANPCPHPTMNVLEGTGWVPEWE